ncbi:MAG: protein kinase [candidate division Zixibacteria bacterium]|nr:protein kinase [candidate division Zixibacteria bacterium]
MSHDSSRDDDDSNSPVVLLPGTQIADYTIIEKIGAGGMGEVYLAKDTKLRRQIALKFLPPNYSGDSEFRDRFLREAQAAAAVNHPNIITVFDFAEFQGRPYIAMEYFDGTPLKDLLQDQKLSESDIVRIGVDVAEGLEKAHEAGIVHRDIKSDNILVDDSGRIKIFDFGLAREKENVDLTQAGTILGTVSYMSPEQAQGSEVDHRSDLFSFGVVLYELVAGCLPFTGEYMAAIIYSVVNDEAEPLSAKRKDVSTDLEQIVGKLMTKDLDKRYQSATEALSDLRRLVVIPEVPATSVRGGRRVGLSTILLIAAVVLLGVALMTNMLPFQLAETDSDRNEMIAVLPFENLGDQGDDFFATGIADEITTQLTKLSGLGVISRSSTAQYKGSGKSHRQIADELGSDYILEGAIHWDKRSAVSRVRVTTTLSRVQDAIAVWAESYDEILADIFAVQSDIARKVSHAMNVTLLDSEDQSLDQQPTNNTEAYTYYLRGQDLFKDRNWLKAQQLFESAIAIDTSFASAWAMLSRTHSLIYWWYIDRTDERLALSKEAAEQALELAPNLGEAYLAMGRYHYRGYLDYTRALEQYELAIRLQPNSSDLMFAIGSVKRRQGRWDEAIGDFRRAIVSDPRNRIKLRNLTQTYVLTHEFDSALTTVEKLIALDSTNPGARALKARILANGFGRLDQALEYAGIGNTPEQAPELIDVTVTLCIMGRHYDRALQLLTESRDTDYFTNDSAYLYLQLGEIYHWLGDPEVSRSYYDSSRVVLEEWVRQQPADPSFRSMLGVAYAGSGQTDAAIREGKRALELGPIERDALTGSMWKLNLAIIYLMIEKPVLAAAEIKTLLSMPSDLSSWHIVLHPIFVSMKEVPEIESIMSRDTSQHTSGGSQP